MIGYWHHHHHDIMSSFRRLNPSNDCGSQRGSLYSQSQCSSCTVAFQSHIDIMSSFRRLNPAPQITRRADDDHMMMMMMIRWWPFDSIYDFLWVIFAQTLYVQLISTY